MPGVCPNATRLTIVITVKLTRLHSPGSFGAVNRPAMNAAATASMT
jgi:hypothetical protein